MVLPSFRNRPVDLAVKELAVDPVDVDREQYPVWIRLNRPLTQFERVGLAGQIGDDEGAEVLEDAILLHRAKLDNVARRIHDWTRRVEEAARLGEGVEGEQQVASAEAADRMRESAMSRGSDPSSFMH